MLDKYLYSEIVYNEFLNISKEIKAETYLELNRKVKEELADLREKEVKKRKRLRKKNLYSQTEQDTIEAIQKIEKCKNILSDSLKVNHFIDINSLKKLCEFKEFIFREDPPTIEEVNEEVEVPIKEPIKEFFLKSALNKRLKLEEEVKRILEERKNKYDEKREEAKRKYDEEKIKYINGIKSYNDSIEEFKTSFEKGDEKAIERYVNLVLEKSIYPHEIRKQYEIQYDSSSGVLIISFELPSKEEVPIITEYKYIPEIEEIIDVRMKENEFEEYYEGILYKICLRNLYEVFDALKIDKLKTIVFNGWIDDIDKKTEKNYRACIMSVQAMREEFSKLDLKNENPKECFKRLRGVSTDTFHKITEVKSIVDLNQSDFKSIPCKEVLDDEINLEEMPLEEFEGSIRELFKGIFSKENCDVKVTKVYKDYGVDIVALDPDPIRGGKFVIQVKRYNGEMPCFILP